MIRPTKHKPKSLCTSYVAASFIFLNGAESWGSGSEVAPDKNSATLRMMLRSRSRNPGMCERRERLFRDVRETLDTPDTAMALARLTTTRNARAAGWKDARSCHRTPSFTHLPLLHRRLGEGGLGLVCGLLGKGLFGTHAPSTFLHPAEFQALLDITMLEFRGCVCGGGREGEWNVRRLRAVSAGLKKSGASSRVEIEGTAQAWSEARKCVCETEGNQPAEL